MSDVGKIGWLDLTVEDAESVKSFYQAVAGWQPQAVAMDGYSDFNMCVDDEPVAGICHARGGNAGIPARWMMYVTVTDIEAAMQQAEQRDGKIIHRISNSDGNTTMAYVEDPAGAVFALYQSSD